MFSIWIITVVNVEKNKKTKIKFFNKWNLLKINLIIEKINKRTKTKIKSKDIIKKISYNFLLISLINLNRLTFYSFSLTRQLWINLNIILILWIIIIIIASKNTKKIIYSFRPKFCPAILINFIILIEFIRFNIRPLILILRISINIFSGHIIITLISSKIFERITLFLSIYIRVLLITVIKIIIRLAQRIILIILLIIYLNELRKIII